MSLELFNTIPVAAPKRTPFNLSHRNLLTCEMGTLYPFLCEPVLPGETWKVSTEQIIRFSPLKAPIMTELDVYVHFYFVPTRIIWSQWEDFITGSHNGRKLDEDELPLYPRFVFAAHQISKWAKGNDGSSSDPTTPWLFSDDHTSPLANRSLADYLDFQTYKTGEAQGNFVTDYAVDALPFRAYQKIFFDYYMDENLYDPDGRFTDILESEIERDGDLAVGAPHIPTEGTPTYSEIIYNMMTKRRRAWRKDYFTSALPWAQKGDDVLIPGSGGSVSGTLQRNFSPVSSDNKFLNDFVSVRDAGIGNVQALSASASGESLSPHAVRLDAPVGGDVTTNFGLNVDNFSVDLSSVGEGTIRELWRAFAAQRFLQRRAIGGTRYIEQNLSMFGARSSDGRLQRSEYLGGMKQPVVVSQILQTSQTTEGENGSPLGMPAGNAVSVGGKPGFKRTFEEYGYVIGIMSIMPRSDYMQGIPRKYQKTDPYDFYWPQFAKIGEQEIKNSELFFDASPTSNGQPKDNDGVFGYAPRYSEYKFIPNRIHGDFKDTLSFWHLGRAFSEIPKLNKDFIDCRPSSRIFAVDDTDSDLALVSNHLWVEMALKVKALRPMPMHGTMI